MEPARTPPTPPAQSPTSAPPREEPTPHKTPCVACGRPIDPWDAYCRYCGRTQQIRPRWYYHPVWIIVLALTLLGPFAIPLVVLSPQMNRTGKWILSLGILFYTLIVVGMMGWLTMLMIDRYQAMSEGMMGF